MRASLGGDLRQVRDGHNLHLASQLVHDVAHLVGYVSRDTCIHLVEDDGRKSREAGDHGFEAEHQT